MRLGFILGFLTGGGIASFLGRMKEQAEVATEEAALRVGDAAEAASGKVNPVIGRVKQQVNDARDAAREAQLEKEAEMRQTYENMVHRKPATDHK